MKRLLLIAFALALVALAVAPSPSAAQTGGTIQIRHAPPDGVTPGHQIFLLAFLTSASAGTVSWRNATMTADAVVPMTNLSLANGTGWGFGAYLPAQDSPTQISYTINASNNEGFHTESYFLSVDVAAQGGLTTADQEAWALTVAASLSMAASTIAVLYWYTGRRLRRGVR